MSKRKDLNKGLRALLSNIQTTTNVEEKNEMVKELTSSVSSIRLEGIEVNPYQPRIEFDSDELMELAKSIKVHGLIQPITVRSMGGDTYQLISGERRLRASKMAGLVEIPAYIRVANDQEMLEMALIENIQRAELNDIEVAISYQRLIDECSLTHETLSDRIGKNRSTVTNYLRLLKLPPEIQNALKKKDISMGHARALAGVPEISAQLDSYKKTLADHLSVRQLEALLKSNAQNTEAKPKIGDKESYNPSSIEIERIKKELSAVMGVKVEINRNNKGKGKIVISFANDKQFNELYDILLGNIE